MAAQNSNRARPWMTAIEKQFAALRYARELSHSDSEIKRRRLHYLESADTFAWTPEITRAVQLASKSIPRATTISEVVPPTARPCWFWFGDSLPINPYAGGDKTICAILVSPCDRNEEKNWPAGVTIVALVTTDDEREIPHPWTSWIWPWMSPLSELDYRDDAIIDGKWEHLTRSGRSASYEISAFVLAACVWMSQKIITWSDGSIERHRRKQLARENNVLPPSDVKVIQLRRSESHSYAHSPEHESVDWSCRWIVGGHWRNQPYKDERKLIYIMPYVKGPEGKPLKVSTHTVYAVNR